MKNLTKTLLAVLAGGLVSSALSTHEAQAAHINGTIGFTGAVQFDSSHLDTATEVMLWRDANGNLGFSNVASTTGDFSGIPLGFQATVATPWTFNPLHVYSGSLECSGVRSSGAGVTFNLLSATIVSQTADFLNITGTGTISASGFEDTVATWSFTIPDAGGDPDFFTFAGADGCTRSRCA